MKNNYLLSQVPGIWANLTPRCKGLDAPPTAPLSLSHFFCFFESKISRSLDTRIDGATEDDEGVLLADVATQNEECDVSADDNIEADEKSEPKPESDVR